MNSQEFMATVAIEFKIILSNLKEESKKKLSPEKHLILNGMITEIADVLQWLAVRGNI